MKALRWNEKITQKQRAEIIEAFVNNPNINITELGKKYNLLPPHVYYLISRWFYKVPSENTEIIVKSSSINDEILLKKAV